MFPSVIEIQGLPGQSFTRTLTICNQTPSQFAFDMVAYDVLVKDGKRIFVPSGETPGSIAVTATFSRNSVIVNPGEEASVQFTITIPRETRLRAVVALFRGTNKISSGGSVMMTASLGSLVTFTLGKDVEVNASPVQVGQQTESTNLSILQSLTNSGAEAIMPKGAAAILDAAGKKVGTLAFPSQRLLPGERLEFNADCPFQLKPGQYRVVTSFQYGSKVVTTEGEFGVS